MHNESCNAHIQSRVFPSRWHAALSDLPSAYESLHVIVSFCQEDLSWLACDWHPRMVIHLYHKCNSTHPGVNKVGFHDTLPKPWSPKPIPPLACAVHDYGHSAGWESTAYLAHVVHAYSSFEPAGLYVFLQGGRGDEVHGPMAKLTMRAAVQRVLQSNCSFSSLSFALARGAPASCKGILPLDALRRWRGQELGCERGYTRPLRGSFAVAGSRVLALQQEQWRSLLRIALDRFDADPSRHGDDFENAWSTLFGCMHDNRCPSKYPDYTWGKHTFSVASFDCFDEIRPAEAASAMPSSNSGAALSTRAELPTAKTDPMFDRVFLRSPNHAAGAARAPPESEGGLGLRWRGRCLSFAEASQCAIEYDEWMLVDALVRSDDVVLEFGARYGTTSCRLAVATNNSGLVVSVEPDHNVIPALLRNRETNRCNFAIAKGVVSKTPLRFYPSHIGYASKTRSWATGGKEVDRITEVGDIERSIGAAISVLLIDCEGCIASVFAGPNVQLLQRVRLILIEEDGPSPTATNFQGFKDNASTFYQPFFDMFVAAGFERRWHIADTPGFVMGHSAWLRRGAPPTISCEEYASTRPLVRGHPPRCLQA